jgi:hypothetical protein
MMLRNGLRALVIKNHQHILSYGMHLFLYAHNQVGSLQMKMWFGPHNMPCLPTTNKNINVFAVVF